MVKMKCANCGHEIERVKETENRRIARLFKGEMVHSNLGSKLFNKKDRKWAMYCRVKLSKHKYCGCTNPEPERVCVNPQAHGITCVCLANPLGKNQAEPRKDGSRFNNINDYPEPEVRK